MNDYLKKFENHSQYESFVGGGTMVKPNVSYCVEQNEVHYNPWTWADEYLTFVALENNTSFRFTDRLPNYQLSYSLNNGSTWTVLEGDNTVTINTDEKILWKGGLIRTRAVVDPSNIGVFTSTKHFNAMGNIMSLAYSDNFVENNTLPKNTDFFKKLFTESYVVDAGNLVLPATVLTNECYSNMFQGCTSLTTAPELPATTLAERCYTYMFWGCTSLTTAPELPATTLAESCYYSMFSGCTSLVTAPELPATTLASSCYESMFNGCTSLTTAPELPATTLASYCYRYMFDGCTSLTTAPELPATTLAESCYSWMFNNCTSLVTAPELLATTLANSCYESMFNGCTNLNYIKAMFTTTPSTTYTNKWVNGVASSGTFVKNSAAKWNVTGVNGIPSGWTIETITALPKKLIADMR